MVTIATVTSLTASPATDGINLSVEFDDPHAPSGLPYLKTSAIEYWASQTNNRATATKVTEGFTAAKHAGLSANATWYYWARARSADGSADGEFYPVSTTAGVAATVFADSNAWINWTPTITPLSGSFSSQPTLSIHRYKLITKVCEFQLYMQLPSAGGLGTASGGELDFTLPFTAAANNFSVDTGYKLPGGICFVSVFQSAVIGQIFRGDGASMVQADAIVACSGNYEIT